MFVRVDAYGRSFMMKVCNNYLNNTLSLGQKVYEFPPDFSFKDTRLLATNSQLNIVLHDSYIDECCKCEDRIGIMCDSYLSMGYDIHWFKYPSTFVAKYFGSLLKINSANWYEEMPKSFTQSVDNILNKNGSVSIRFKTPIPCVLSDPDDSTIPHVEAVVVN